MRILFEELCLDFNPRSRKGSDSEYGHVYKSFPISIHAPARGATMYLYAPLQFDLFQSTLPQGERHLSFFLKPFRFYFNPRSRKGSDDDPDPTLRHIVFISIHAPARGATGLDYWRLNCKKISIHAPARGATAESPYLYLAARISIHAPARGATMMDLSEEGYIVISIHAPARGATQRTFCSEFAQVFQSTLPQGERPGKCKRGSRGKQISIHAPARGATHLIRQG